MIEGCQYKTLKVKKPKFKSISKALMFSRTEKKCAKKK